MKKTVLISIFITSLFASCSVEYQPINYGSDSCDFCRMGIVEKKFGGEIVTKKGKIFKYDAIECVINALADMEENKLAFILSVDYNDPTQLVDVHTSYYLRSDNIPSPMGAFLSTYSTKEEVERAKAKHGGEIMNWDILKSKFITNQR